MEQCPEPLRREPRNRLTNSRMKGPAMKTLTRPTAPSHGYAPVNGLKMYYEIEGTGDPLIFIPPAFGFAGRVSFPDLIPAHSVVTVDLQGNGRTADIPERPV